MKLLWVGDTDNQFVQDAFKGRYLLVDHFTDWKDTADRYDAVFIQGSGYSETKYNWEWALSKGPAIVVLSLIQDNESVSGSASKLWSEIKQKYRTTEREDIGIVHLYLGYLLKDADLERELSCVHRSAKPVRTVGCKPCATRTGLPAVPIFHCALYDCECAVASNELEGQGKMSPRTQKRLQVVTGCTACPDRKPG